MQIINVMHVCTVVLYVPFPGTQSILHHSPHYTYTQYEQEGAGIELPTLHRSAPEPLRPASANHFAVGTPEKSSPKKKIIILQQMFGVYI